MGMVKQIDYFSIPAVMSTNKNDVKIFQRLWEKYIGECEIIYTRNTSCINISIRNIFNLINNLIQEYKKSKNAHFFKQSKS